MRLVLARGVLRAAEAVADTLREPPRYNVISGHFGVFAELAKACGVDRACEGPRMARMTFTTAHAAKSHNRQT